MLNAVTVGVAVAVAVGVALSKAADGRRRVTAGLTRVQ